MQHQLTISALARAEGVDQAAMSRLVKQLKLETSPGPRGAKLVAVASYLQAVGRPATEQLQPPSDQLERLARKGKLGTARECASRLAAARSYQHLVKAAASRDMNAHAVTRLKARSYQDQVKFDAGSKAHVRIREIEDALGIDGARRCRAMLIDGQSLRSAFAGLRRSYVLQYLREYLDCIAEKLSMGESISRSGECAHET